MKRLIKRWALSVLILIAISVCLLTFRISSQQVTVTHPGSTAHRAGCVLPSWTPINPGQLVLLDVHDFGYSAYVRNLADAPTYDGFIVYKDVLSRIEANFNKPLVIRAGTKAAVNLIQDSSKINGDKYPLLIDSLPWTLKSRGAPLLPGHRYEQSWLRHRLTITGIARDGTVTITAGPKRVYLKPGSEVKIERSMKPWRSTVTIRNRGLFDKNKIQPSRWLSVKTH